MKGWLKDKAASREFEHSKISKSFSPPKSQWVSEARVYEVEAYPGEQELALMAEHFELQVGQVEKFQKPRPPPVQTSRGRDNSGISETSEKGKGASRQTTQGNLELGFWCFHSRYTFSHVTSVQCSLVRAHCISGCVLEL